jgi:hypothetical protein
LKEQVDEKSNIVFHRRMSDWGAVCDEFGLLPQVLERLRGRIANGTELVERFKQLLQETSVDTFEKLTGFMTGDSGQANLKRLVRILFPLDTDLDVMKAEGFSLTLQAVMGELAPR